MAEKKGSPEGDEKKIRIERRIRVVSMVSLAAYETQLGKGCTPDQVREFEYRLPDEDKWSAIEDAVAWGNRGDIEYFIEVTE